MYQLCRCDINFCENSIAHNHFPNKQFIRISFFQRCTKHSTWSLQYRGLTTCKVCWALRESTVVLEKIITWSDSSNVFLHTFSWIPLYTVVILCITQRVWNPKKKSTFVFKFLLWRHTSVKLFFIEKYQYVRVWTYETPKQISRVSNYVKIEITIKS